MLNKLLKYDLKYMIRNMSPFYILAIFFAITTRILFSLKQSVIVSVIGQISVGALFSMVFSIIFNTVIRSWIRFREVLYKDEAYLTHTLPVSKNNIYNSKFLQTLIFFIVGFIIMLVSLFIAYYTKDRWVMLINFIKGYTTGIGFKPWFFISGMLLLIFLELFNAIQSGFLGIIYGHRKNNYKIGYSIFYSFVIYLLSQGLVLLMMYIIGLFDSSIMDLFKVKVQVNVETFKLVMIMAIIIYIVLIIIMQFISKKALNKGVNIE